MKVLLIVLLGAVATLGGKIRVFNGREAFEGQFPYSVSVRNNSTHICGGSILDETTILTSARCVLTFSPDEVVAGSNLLSSGGDSYTVTKTIYHQGFEITKNQNDIAIMKLANAIKFNDKVQSIKLRQNPVGGEETCTVNGWGASYRIGFPDALRFANLQTVDMETCKASHWDPEISDSQICTTSTINFAGACFGDIGGPLVDDNGDQIGISSLGLACVLRQPDIYTNVYAYLDWIQTNRN